MSIAFSLIPSNWQLPGAYAEVDNSGAVQGTPAQRRPVLLVGTRSSAGTVAEGVVTPITAATQGVTYFGRGSQLAHMIERFIGANPNAELYACALNEDAAGVKAHATITVTGTATEDGTIPLLIGGRKVNAAVSEGDDDAAVASAINSAIGANLDLMATSAAVDEVVTVTARHKGASGNGLSIFTCYYAGEKLPAGISLAITAFGSGATDPDVADAIAALGGEAYYTIVSAYTLATNMATWEAEMLSRWSPLVDKPGHVMGALRDTYANSQTYGNARNSAFSSVLATGKSPTPPWEAAAILAAVEVAENDPARPRQNRLLPGLLAPLPADRFANTERNLLLLDGMATMRVDTDGCYLERLVTTFQTTGGIADPSYHDIETLRTLAYLRHSLVSRFRLRYPSAKLANDGTNFGPGQSVLTPKLARGEVLALFSEWERDGLVENAAQFKSQLVVERNANDPNRLDIFLPPDLINQARVIAAAIGFKL